MSYLLTDNIGRAHCHCGYICTQCIINSLAPERSECDSKNVIFNLVLPIGIFRSSHVNALRGMPQDLTDDKSTLVQVMAWCRQATSHYLSQCWLSSLSPYGVARPQWVKHATMQSHNNMGDRPQNTHNRLPIALLWGQAMGCLLWCPSMIYVLPLHLAHCIIIMLLTIP